MEMSEHKFKHGDLVVIHDLSGYVGDAIYKIHSRIHDEFDDEWIQALDNYEESHEDPYPEAVLKAGYSDFTPMYVVYQIDEPEELTGTPEDYFTFMMPAYESHIKRLATDEDKKKYLHEEQDE